MKKITLAIFMATLTTFFACLCTATPGPFQPHDYDRFIAIETMTANGALAPGPTLADGSIIVGNGSALAKPVVMSGDTTISNAGAVTIGASKVTTGMILVDTILAVDIATGGVATAEILDGTILETDITVDTADGKNLMRVVRANLDCGVSDCSAGTVSMVQTLPAKALIYQSWWYTETQFVDGGSGTVAFHCEDANNIFTAADITGNADGSIIAGNQTGVIATMTAAIASSCTITATIATAEQTAGVLTLYVMYTVHD